MSVISADDIISIIKNEIENYDWDNEAKETGEVIWVGDGIATVYGIDHAMYGEIVVFDGGVKGMVQNIRRNEIGCILFGHDESIREGCKVIRTGKRAGIPVGDAFKGRVVNALGEPIDGKGDITSTEYRAIEEPAPAIIDRQPVDTPLETGILSIDSIFPNGRGQREVIICELSTTWKNMVPWNIPSSWLPWPATPLLFSTSHHTQVQRWQNTLCTKDRMP